MRTRTVGGCVRFTTFGTRDERGHTSSDPQMPMGMTGAPVRAASFAAPQRPSSLGSKKASPRGMVPCGRIATTWPPAIASAARSSGTSEPEPRSTRMPPMAVAS